MADTTQSMLQGINAGIGMFQAGSQAALGRANFQRESEFQRFLMDKGRSEMAMEEAMAPLRRQQVETQIHEAATSIQLNDLTLKDRELSAKEMPFVADSLRAMSASDLQSVINAPMPSLKSSAAIDAWQRGRQNLVSTKTHTVAAQAQAAIIGSFVSRATRQNIPASVQVMALQDLQDHGTVTPEMIDYLEKAEKAYQVDTSNMERTRVTVDSSGRVSQQWTPKRKEYPEIDSVTLKEYGWFVDSDGKTKQIHPTKSKDELSKAQWLTSLQRIITEANRTLKDDPQNRAALSQKLEANKEMWGILQGEKSGDQPAQSPIEKPASKQTAPQGQQLRAPMKWTPQGGLQSNQ